MNFNSIHVLLTYQCNFECDHCFVWGSPRQTGVFTMDQLEEVFQQALALNRVNEFYFEGGEAFLYYPLLVHAIQRASELGFATGLVTNGYWATAGSDARLWLRPLVAAGVGAIEISCDLFHGDKNSTPDRHPGLLAAAELGVKAGSITIDSATTYRDPETDKPGKAISGGDVRYRGRAAEKLTDDLPRQLWHAFKNCPYENLVDPGRIHLDPLGNLHICQGVVIGNLFEQPLAEIAAGYDPAANPVVGPLLAGGPAQLVHEYGLPHESAYVDACHLCYTARKMLRPRFPAVLAPDQMYGDGGTYVHNW